MGLKIWSWVDINFWQQKMLPSQFFSLEWLQTLVCQSFIFSQYYVSQFINSSSIKILHYITIWYILYSVLWLKCFVISQTRINYLMLHISLLYLVHLFTRHNRNTRKCTLNSNINCLNQVSLTSSTTIHSQFLVTCFISTLHIF